MGSHPLAGAGHPDGQLRQNGSHIGGRLPLRRSRRQKRSSLRAYRRVWGRTNGKANLVLAGDPLKGTNGLLVDDNQLLIGNGDGSLLSLNPATKQLITLAKVSGGIDGIVALGTKPTWSPSGPEKFGTFMPMGRLN